MIRRLDAEVNSLFLGIRKVSITMAWPPDRLSLSLMLHRDSEFSIWFPWGLDLSTKELQFIYQGLGY